jgi:hypothetical protein
MQLSEQQFADAIVPAYQLVKWRIEHLEQEARERGRDRNYPWNCIVTSFATNGGVRHYEVTLNGRYDEFNWDSVNQLNDQDRKDLFEEITNPRRRVKLAGKLEENFQNISEIGGNYQYSELLRSQNGACKKLDMLQRLKGIGKKYSRNILMDGHDESAQDYIAIDSRIENLLAFTTVENKNYILREDYLRQVAKNMCVTCWQLDRFLFTFADVTKIFLSRAANMV